jgi:hypothetical protein
MDGHTIMFKIDYFDREPSMHSPDPADPDVTQRVITIMLADSISCPVPRATNQTPA